MLSSYAQHTGETQFSPWCKWVGWRKQQLLLYMGSGCTLFAAHGSLAHSLAWLEQCCTVVCHCQDDTTPRGLYCWISRASCIMMYHGFMMEVMCFNSCWPWELMEHPRSQSELSMITKCWDHQQVITFRPCYWICRGIIYWAKTGQNVVLDGHLVWSGKQYLCFCNGNIVYFCYLYY